MNYRITDWTVLVRLQILDDTNLADCMCESTSLTVDGSIACCMQEALTGVQTLGDGCRINEIPSTQPTGDVFIDPLHLHNVLRHKIRKGSACGGFCRILSDSSVIS